MEKFRLVAPCLFGLESILKDEIQRLGYDIFEVMYGRVVFSGDFEAVARANMFLRTGERILIELGRFPATTFEQLFQGVKKLPLEDFIGPLNAFPVKGTSLKRKLNSVPYCKKIIKKAAVSRLGAIYGISYFEESEPRVQIQFMLFKDMAYLYLDTTGAALYKRGYRAQSGAAPLRETIAAAMVRLSRYTPGIPFYDPMCGSGTIAIEAAMAAADMAPGLGRKFDYEYWDCVPVNLASQARSEAIDRRKPLKEPVIFASDFDETAVELTRHNATLAGIKKGLWAEKADVADFVPKGERGVIVTNPPYGERLLDAQQASAVYKKMSSLLIPGHRLYVIAPLESDFEMQIGRSPDKKRKIYNGMLTCNIYQYFKKTVEIK